MVAAKHGQTTLKNTQAERDSHLHEEDNIDPPGCLCLSKRPSV